MVKNVVTWDTVLQIGRYDPCAVHTVPNARSGGIIYPDRRVGAGL